MKRETFFAVARLTMAFSFAIAICTTVNARQQPAGTTRVIVAETLYTMDGPAIENGMVLVQDGKIVAVGKDLKIPAGATTTKVSVLMPGMVDAYTSAGVTGGTAEMTSEITPEMDVVHAIDWTSRDFKRASEAGITTVHVLPGSDNVFAGGSCVAKVAGEKQQRVLNGHLGSVLAVCSDPVNGNSSRSRPESIYVRQPTNRMGVVWIIRSELHKVANEGRDDTSASSVALRKILGGEPVFTVSRTGYDIETVARLNSELGFKSTIVSGEEAWKSIDLLKETGMQVIYAGMTTGSETGTERTNLHWNTPGKLQDAGIVFCLAGGQLLEQARFAVRFGLPEETALNAITTTPARMLGLSDRIGAIRAGMDADLVALDGPPLEFTTGRIWTMVDGNTLDASKQLSSVASDTETIQ